jgi:hypothetical protein
MRNVVGNGPHPLGAPCLRPGYPRTMEHYRVSHYAIFGTGEAWVARLMFGLRDLVFAIPAFGSTRDDFMAEMSEVLQAVGIAYQELGELRKRLSEGAAELDVARAFQNLYGSLARAIEDRFTAAMKALGFDIGFMFARDHVFERKAAHLLAERPALNELIELIREDRHVFLSDLAEYRDSYLEHRRKRPNRALLARLHRLDSAETTFANVWTAIEEYVALYAKAHLPPDFSLVEIPEAQRDPQLPKRFQIALDNVPGEHPAL